MSETDNPVNNIPLYKPDKLPHRKKLSAKGLQAERKIKKYSILAGGIGLIPVPLFGQVAVSVYLVKLLRDLCQIYDVPFSNHQVKIIVSSILGGAHTNWITFYLMKYINGYKPALTPVNALLLRPAISGLVVYYVGKLFLGHLESGAWLRVKEKGLSQFG